MKSGSARKFFRKASMYDMLAAYYKYTNMELHIYYYKKHLKYLQKAIMAKKMQPSRNRMNGHGLVRFLHAAPDAPEADIYVNGARILSDFPYKKASNYLSLPEGKYQIDVYPAGNQVATIISRKIEVKNGKYCTFAAYGQGKNLKLLTYEDNPFTNNGESTLRFVNLSPDSPSMDIAVRHGDTAFREIQPRKASNYLHVTPMNLDLDIREMDSGQTVKELPRIQLQPNIAYTVYIIGLSEGQPSLEAIMLTP